MDELYKKIKKQECIKIIDDYYKSIGRTNPPKFETYSLHELKLCLRMFNIKLSLDK